MTNVEKDLSKLLGIEFDPYNIQRKFFQNGEYGPLKNPLQMEPCPCCGGASQLELVRMYNRWGWRVMCRECGVRTMTEAINWPCVRPSGVEGVGNLDESTRYTSAQAAEIVISKWNRRPAAAV